MSLSVPWQTHPHLPKKLPLSLGFDKYSLDFNSALIQRINCGVGVSLDITAAITLEMMVYTRETNNYRGIMNKFDPTLGNYAYYLLTGNQNGNIYFAIRDAGVEYDCGRTNINNVILNRWIHVAGTYDGSNIRLYYNLINTNTVIHVGLIDSKPATPLVIAAKSDEIVSSNIIVAYARIYNIALTNTQLMYNALNYHNPLRTGLVMWLDMEEGSGITAIDRSGNGNNGSLLPAPTPPTWIRNKKWELRAETNL